MALSPRERGEGPSTEHAAAVHPAGPGSGWDGPTCRSCHRSGTRPATDWNGSWLSGGSVLRAPRPQRSLTPPPRPRSAWGPFTPPHGLLGAPTNSSCAQCASSLSATVSWGHCCARRQPLPRIPPLPPPQSQLRFPVRGAFHSCREHPTLLYWLARHSEKRQPLLRGSMSRRCC